MAKDFPKLMSDTKTWIQVAQRATTRINAKISIPRNIILKLQKKNTKRKYFKKAIQYKYLQRNKNKNYIRLNFRNQQE